jgi:hypothetical protein
MKKKLANANKKTNPKNLPPFDKYWHYAKSVQSPEIDVKFFRKTYKKIFEKEPVLLREDFCGTFNLCCEWVKLRDEHKALGFDLDQEPLDYGKEKNLSLLSEEQQSRIQTKNQNVITSTLNTPSDITVAVNFSYFIFKERAELKKYFQNVYDNLDQKGLYLLDIFGGSDIFDLPEEETEYEDEAFSYYWDQEEYNPILNEGLFHIHFKRKGEKKRKSVFTYDWRVWSIAEIRDILTEVGFAETRCYWEGTDEDGEGDGVFEATDKGEANIESFVAYVAGIKR